MWRDWAMVDDGLQGRRQEREDALVEIGRALEAMTERQRGPDAWERFYLVHALQTFFSGIYRFAAVQAQMALQPHEERSRDYRAPFGPALMSCDLPVLQQAYQAAIKADLVAVPRLGPISLADTGDTDGRSGRNTQPAVRLH